MGRASLLPEIIPTTEMQRALAKVEAAHDHQPSDAGPRPPSQYGLLVNKLRFLFR